MVELNHNVANVNSDGVVKGAHGVIVGVKVTKAGTSGSKIELKNGIVTGAAVEFTVYGEAVQDLGDINRRFEAGIYADITGDAEYLIIFK